MRDDPKLFAGLNRRYRELYLRARGRGGRRAEDDGGPAAPGAPPEHAAFRRRVADLLAEADMPEAERQRLLASIACPCCGGAGASMSLKIRTDGALRF